MEDKQELVCALLNGTIFNIITLNDRQRWFQGQDVEYLRNGTR